MFLLGKQKILVRGKLQFDLRVSTLLEKNRPTQDDSGTIFYDFCTSDLLRKLFRALLTMIINASTNQC